MTVRLPDAAPLDRRRCAERSLLIGSIEAWLQHHHRAVALPNAGDGIRGDTICVGFRQDQIDAAFAYRVFCGKLGLAPTLKQFRVEPNRCRRTTPPA